MQTILSSPETGASSVRIMYYFGIVCSRRLIYIANPYFVPDQAAIDTLIEAKKRGVDVKIMVSGIHNDNRLVRRSSRRLYGQLLAGGVEIYEYNRTMLHHKIMVVDGLWATVGTTNFDNRSFAHNEENNVCFFDPHAFKSFGQRLKKICSTANASDGRMAAPRRLGEDARVGRFGSTGADVNDCSPGALEVFRLLHMHFNLLPLFLTVQGENR